MQNNKIIRDKKSQQNRTLTKINDNKKDNNKEQKRTEKNRK